MTYTLLRHSHKFYTHNSFFPCSSAVKCLDLQLPPRTAGMQYPHPAGIASLRWQLKAGWETPRGSGQYLHRSQLDGSDAWGIHHGLWPVGRVCQQTVPLLGQPRELLLPVVEAGVDPVLEVGGPGNLQPFLLFPEHGGQIWRSHREKGKKRKKKQTTHVYTLL